MCSVFYLLYTYAFYILSYACYFLFFISSTLPHMNFPIKEYYWKIVQKSTVTALLSVLDLLFALRCHASPPLFTQILLMSVSLLRAFKFRMGIRILWRFVFDHQMIWCQMLKRSTWLKLTFFYLESGQTRKAHLYKLVGS